MTAELSEDVRRIDLESQDLESWIGAATLVFKEPILPAADLLESRRRRYHDHRLSAAFDGDQVVATFRSWDTALTLAGGGHLIADAISSVTVLPTHRRRGLMSAMMSADLAEAAGRGISVAVLLASEAEIYGRFGFGAATEAATWRLDVRAARRRPEVQPAGSVRVIPESALREIAPAVYTAARRAGAIDRTDAWWDGDLAPIDHAGKPRPPRIAAVYRNEAGTVAGYLIYRIEEHWVDRVCRTTVRLDALEAVDQQSYAALWGYLIDLDLVDQIIAEDRAVDEALPWLLIDPRAARQTSRADFLWARLLDPATALTARRYDAAGRVTFEVVDDAGYAAGHYLLDVDASGAARCERTEAPAELTLTVEALSSVWLGGGNLAAQAIAGLVVEHRTGAVARLSRLLHTTGAPWMSTWF